MPEMEGVPLNPTWDRYEPVEIPQPRESPIPILRLDPKMIRNVTNLGDDLAQHRGVQQVVIRLLKSVPHA